jgi:hypothetical protein
MSTRHRHTASAGARRRWTVALAACVLASGVAAAWAAAAAGQTPTTVIDASDPKQLDEAGRALNLCDTLDNCKWVVSDRTTGWGPQRVIGDAAYNCSDSTDSGATVESSYGVEETREESTSVQETAKLKVSLSILDLETTSAEFEAFSKQLSSFSTSVETTIALSLEPGHAGYMQWSMWGAQVTGSAYVTDGINLIQVKDIDLDFPGYYNSRTDANASKIAYTTHQHPMTPAEFDQYCHRVTGQPPTSNTMDSSKLTLCDGAECDKQTVTGPLPQSLPPATVVITDSATGLVHARGAVTRGRIRVNTRRPIVSGGNYQLILKEPATVKGSGRTRTRHQVQTHVPIAVP